MGLFNQIRSVFQRTLGTAKYSIIVTQYERWTYSAGSEEQLHWAIVVLTDEDIFQSGPMYQIQVNRATGAWELSTSPKVTLEKSAKCLGGLRVGTIRRRELKHLRRVILANIPIEKFSGWNCRDWVMECLEVMQDRGWVHEDLAHQEDLLPGMREASALTLAIGKPQVISLYQT